jgi:hypothetical protein
VTTSTADVLHFSCHSTIHIDRTGDRMDIELQLAGHKNMTTPKPLDIRHISGWQLPVLFELLFLTF